MGVDAASYGAADEHIASPCYEWHAQSAGEKLKNKSQRGLDFRNPDKRLVWGHVESCGDILGRPKVESLEGTDGYIWDMRDGDESRTTLKLRNGHPKIQQLGLQIEGT